MIKQLYTFVGLLFVLTISSAIGVHAQSKMTAKASIPFDFSVKNQTMTAGDYVINQADDQGSVWTLRSRDNHQSIFLLAMVEEPKTRSDKGKMTFRRYGNKYFLTTIETPDYQIGLRKSRAERQLEKSLEDNNRLAKNDGKGVTPEIVAIELSM
jgi:hypothetical protein